MSEAAAERPSAPRPQPGGGANVFTRKYGPLPGWGWAALAAVAAAGYLWYRNRQGGSTATDPAAGQDVNAAVGDDIQGQLATIQTEIQNLQGMESQEDGTSATPTNSGGTMKPAGPYRHVSDGTKTLNQIAKARGTSVAHILSVSGKGPEGASNLAKLEAWARHPGTKRKGIVYYTSNK